MLLPNVWGKGQIFAFSGIEGPSFERDDFTGILSGDRIGIRFLRNCERDLSLIGIYKPGLTVDIVTSDLIAVTTPSGERAVIIFAARDLVVGTAPAGTAPVVFTEYASSQEEKYDLNVPDRTEISVQDTHDGDVTVLARRGTGFAFAFGHEIEATVRTALKGLDIDVSRLEQDKLAFYSTHDMHITDESRLRLSRKCMSVMKTQIYSPEEEYQMRRSTPDRVPHAHLWLWDSVFHAVGFRHFDGDLAMDLIRAIFVHAGEDGFIPHMAYPGGASSVTQPPVIAWGALKVYEKTNDKGFLTEVYEHNAAFLDWLRRNRRRTDAELYSWHTTDDINCRCDESGMDNSPRFDIKAHLFAIDFSCYMANDVRHMAKIARILGKPDDAARYDRWFDAISSDIEKTLWGDDGYRDMIISTGKLSEVNSVASFLPLFAGVCSKEHADILADQLKNDPRFATDFPIPSIALNDATFGTDMWRGPVWINFNYMIALGLIEYGYTDQGNELIERTISVIDSKYRTTGTIFEFYDSADRVLPTALNRKGEPFEPYNFNVRYRAIHDYGWSCTLLFDMLVSHYGR